MGIYDSVQVNCPHCNGQNEIQSKHGECELRTFHQDAVPVAIAGWLHNATQRCEECKRPFHLRMTGPPMVPLISVPDTETEDEDYPNPYAKNSPR